MNLYKNKRWRTKNSRSVVPFSSDGISPVERYIYPRRLVVISRVRIVHGRRQWRNISRSGVGIRSRVSGVSIGVSAKSRVASRVSTDSGVSTESGGGVSAQTGVSIVPEVVVRCVWSSIGSTQTWVVSSQSRGVSTGRVTVTQSRVSGVVSGIVSGVITTVRVVGISSTWKKLLSILNL